mmetsp:Transcript_28802/g.63463  ORF Transcript_28802/g.63463 Transcript_28802/m.63463 type:complete len:317 (+) Transcript_28802:47-997(+)
MLLEETGPLLVLCKPCLPVDSCSSGLADGLEGIGSLVRLDSAFRSLSLPTRISDSVCHTANLTARRRAASIIQKCWRSYLRRRDALASSAARCTRVEVHTCSFSSFKVSDCIIPERREVSLFTQLGRPHQFHQPRKRVWFQADLPRPQLRLKVPPLDPELPASQIAEILQGGFWGISAPSVTEAEAASSLSLYSQFRVKEAQREAEEAQRLLARQAKYNKQTSRHVVASAASFLGTGSCQPRVKQGSAGAPCAKGGPCRSRSPSSSSSSSWTDILSQIFTGSTVSRGRRSSSHSALRPLKCVDSASEVKCAALLSS